MYRWSYLCLLVGAECKEHPIFSTECDITQFLCAMLVLKVLASSSPLGYLCAKFHFFCGLNCWASPWRKIAYSLTHSLPHLFDAREPKLSLRNNTTKLYKWIRQFPCWSQHIPSQNHGWWGLPQILDRWDRVGIRLVHVPSQDLIVNMQTLATD